MRRSGQVVWFGRSYGFIALDDGSADAFVHYRDIGDGDGYRTLKAGERVSFEVVRTPRGLCARDVFVMRD